LSRPSPAPDALRFHSDRPTDLRAPNPWHRLSYIIEALPAGIEQLAAHLDVPDGGRVLDYGCADQPYRRLFGPGVRYDGADLPGNDLAEIEIQPDGSLPEPDGSFDALLSTQVLEHVVDPRVYLGECFRVLRPGGRMLLTTHGMMVYHPDPIDLWRWTGAGLQHEVRRAGFEIERFEGIMGLTATGLQITQDAIYWKLPRPLRPLLALVAQSLIRLVDRLQSPESRRDNALVYGLVARRP
jgi:SAM-dependent methyltransferase